MVIVWTGFGVVWFGRTMGEAGPVVLGMPNELGLGSAE